MISSRHEENRRRSPPNLDDPIEAERADHIGLRGMHDRVRLLGGTYCLVSAPGQGTLVSVAVPAAIPAEGR